MDAEEPNKVVSLTAQRFKRSGPRVIAEIEPEVAIECSIFEDATASDLAHFPQSALLSVLRQSRDELKFARGYLAASRAFLSAADADSRGAELTDLKAYANTQISGSRSDMRSHRLIIRAVLAALKIQKQIPKQPA